MLLLPMGEERPADAWQPATPQGRALRDALLAPLHDLADAYSQESQFMSYLYQELTRLMERMGSAQPPEEPRTRVRESASTPPSQEPGVELRIIDTERLLEFIDNLGEVPGVGRISVISPGPGRATLLVELLDDGGETNADSTDYGEGLTIVCASCGRVLARGGPDVSHTFCEDCVQKLLTN